MSLTYNDLAEVYKERTGKSARTESFNDVYNWATTQPDIKVNEDTSLEFKQ